MSRAFRFFCNDCEVKTSFVGSVLGIYDEDTFEVNKFLNAHSGHRIEYSEFARYATKPCGVCYDADNCEGDCYAEVRV